MSGHSPVQDAARRNLNSPEMVALRKQMAEWLFTPRTCSIPPPYPCRPEEPVPHRGTLPTWMYEELHRISNLYKVSQEDHDKLIYLAELAFDTGFNEGEGWGRQEGEDR